jgi:hypothetical protein
MNAMKSKYSEKFKRIYLQKNLTSEEFDFCIEEMRNAYEARVAKPPVAQYCQTTENPAPPVS